MKQRVFKLPKNKKVTVADLLGQNEINSTINGLIEKKADIKSILVITVSKDDMIDWRSNNLSDIEVIGLLAQVKKWELDDVGNIGDEEDDDE
jgi:hypothetical protein